MENYIRYDLTKLAIIPHITYELIAKFSEQSTPFDAF